MSNIKIDNFLEEVDEILRDFLHSSFEVRQLAVQAGAEVYKNKLIAASPVATGNFASNWVIKDKVKDHRYVGNTTTVKGKGADGRYRETIPLSNILEYDPVGKPFVRQTYEASVDEIFNAIKQKINGG